MRVAAAVVVVVVVGVVVVVVGGGGQEVEGVKQRVTGGSQNMMSGVCTTIHCKKKTRTTASRRPRA